MCKQPMPTYDYDAVEDPGYSPVQAATTRLRTALESLEKTLDMLKEKLEPVMVPSQPTLPKDQVPRPDYPGGSPVVRDLSFYAEQVGDMIQMIDGISGRLEV